MSETPLKEAWINLKNHKVNIRNCYANGNKEGAIAHIHAAKEQLTRIEQVIASEQN